MKHLPLLHTSVLNTIAITVHFLTSLLFSVHCSYLNQCSLPFVPPTLLSVGVLDGRIPFLNLSRFYAASVQVETMRNVIRMPSLQTEFGQMAVFATPAVRGSLRVLTGIGFVDEEAILEKLCSSFLY